MTTCHGRPVFPECHQRLLPNLSSFLIGRRHLHRYQLHSQKSPCRVLNLSCEPSAMRDEGHSSTPSEADITMKQWCCQTGLLTSRCLRKLCVIARTPVCIYAYSRADQKWPTLHREQGFREWKLTARSGLPPRVKLCQLSSSHGGTLPSITMLGRKRFMSMGSATLLFRSFSDDCTPHCFMMPSSGR